MFLAFIVPATCSTPIHITVVIMDFSSLSQLLRHDFGTYLCWGEGEYETSAFINKAKHIFDPGHQMCDTFLSLH